MLSFCLATLLACGAPPAQDAALPPIEPAVQYVLSSFAERYPNEVVVCLASSDGARIDAWYLPEISQATRAAIATGRCDERSVVAHAHSHPAALLANPAYRVWFYQEFDKEPGGPQDLCYFTMPDAKQAMSEPRARWFVVTVDAETQCWWTSEQVRVAWASGQADARLVLWSLPGQRSWEP